MKRKKDQEGVDKRRKIIYEDVVLRQQSLLVSTLVKKIKDHGYSVRMAQQDVDWFNAFGCQICLTRPPKFPEGNKFEFFGGPHDDDDDARENAQVVEKGLVTRLAAGLICGLSHIRESGLILRPRSIGDKIIREKLDHIALGEGLESEMAANARTVLSHLEEKLTGDKGEPHELKSVKEIFQILGRSQEAFKSRQQELKHVLHLFWQETNRLVAIDSGTTNVYLAKQLALMRFPLAGSSLASLTVCTNSRKIFEVLGPKNVQVKCIVIGGQQKFRTPTIAGAMAESFLRTSSILQFGMCVLGASRIDFDRFQACSDSQEEASMKSLIMDKSSIRVICVDSSKLESRPGREGYRFASLDPEHIHLVVTNSPLIANEGVDLTAFKKSVSTIQARGVPVLIATLDKVTHDL